MERVADTVTEWVVRSEFITPKIRVTFLIDGKKVASFLREGLVEIGRLDETNPASCGIELPGGMIYPLHNGKKTNGTFSRCVIKVSDGVLIFPNSVNRTWATMNERLFHAYSDIDVWNIDTKTEGYIWEFTNPSFWKPVFLLFAWIAKKFIGLPKDVIHMIGRNLRRDLRKSLTLQPFGSQMRISPGETIYVAICNQQLADPAVVRVVIDYVMPLSSEERRKLEKVIAIIHE